MENKLTLTEEETQMIYESIRNHYDSLETKEEEEVYNSIMEKL